MTGTGACLGAASAPSAKVLSGLALKCYTAPDLLFSRLGISPRKNADKIYVMDSELSASMPAPFLTRRSRKWRRRNHGCLRPEADGYFDSEMRTVGCKHTNKLSNTVLHICNSSIAGPPRKFWAFWTASSAIGSEGLRDATTSKYHHFVSPMAGTAASTGLRKFECSTLSTALRFISVP